MRCLSAITRGRSGGRSMRTVCLPPPLRNVFLPWSTRPATSGGLGGDRQGAGLDAPGIQQVVIRPLM